ncbi:hypothetical protein GCM10011506_04910 [Marivirga lumbricoides]|uniref:DUF4185 domain-containing protein n=1 Tax=Marivirga lumbricoides TaxID=1046115 RepID=A0ABQ1LC54_9BACT|nr:hypothetical protein GCM10011506_04910 [Marivirga lumbricoides]
MKKQILAILICSLILLSCKKNSDPGIIYTVSNVSTVAPAGIISWEDIEAGYKGSFSFPTGSEGVKDQNFSYSYGAFCMLDHTSIILEGHTYSKDVRKLILPGNLNGAEATVEGNWFEPTGNLQSTGETSNGYYRLGDLLNIDDRIYFTKYVWYNGSGEDYDSFGYLQKGTSYDNGTAHGMWNADHELAHNMRIGGYLCQAPANLKAKGVTFLAGQEGVSGAALGRWGPNLFAVKFDDTKPVGEDMTAIPLVVHSSESTMPQYWWMANKVHSAVWIETESKHGVMILFDRGYGDTWYGEANANNPPDPYGGGKGYHSSGKQLVAWVYDPVDLMKVYNNEMAPHEVEPVYEKILYDLKPGDSRGEETSYSFLHENRETRMDIKDNRLILLQASFGDQPTGYVVDL